MFEDVLKLKDRPWICYLTAVAVPLTLVILWHAADTVYPNDDYANYFETAQDVYLKFKSAGFIKGAAAAYFDRGWRPVIFPLLAVPFIALTNNDILLSVSLTLISLYLVFLTYAYLIAREFLPPLRSAVCAVFLGTTPWVIVLAYYFMSEMALLAFSAASFYHLMKSGYFSSARHSAVAGLAMGLGIAVRPVEFTLAFALPTTVMVFISFQRKTLRLRDVAVSAAATLLTAAIFAAAFFTTLPMWLLWICGAALTLALFFALLLSGRLRLCRPYLAAFFTCCLITLLWWIAGARGLYSWVRSATGVIGELYHNKGGMGFLKATGSFFAGLGGWPLIGALMLLALGIFAGRRRANNAVRNFMAGNLAAVSMILPPVFMHSLTTDIDYRRAYAGFCALILVNAGLAASHEQALPRLRILLLGVMAGAQVFMISASTFGIEGRVQSVLSSFFKAAPSPLKGGDPSERFLGKLNEMRLGRARIAVFSLSQSQYNERPFDTYALIVLAKKQGSALSFSYPFLFNELSEGYEQLSKNWDYAVVDVSTKGAANDPYSRLTADIAGRWERGALEGVGLSYAGEIHTQAASPPFAAGAQDKTVVVLKVRERPASEAGGVVSITASSNMFPGDKGFSPGYLMEESRTIWHAVSPPKYPEWIEVAYNGPARITSLGIRAQGDGPGSAERARAPKDFVLQASNDRRAWKELVRVTGNIYSEGGQWKQWPVAMGAPCRYYRIYITASNDPGLLTIRQIRLSRDN